MDPQSTDKTYKEGGEIKKIKEEVINRFQPIFSHDNIEQLTAENYRAFLSFKNNKHWTGLSRTGNAIANDMQTLKDKLKILTDEKRPISERFDEADKIKGLGKGIITAILQVAYPEKYGVWNNCVEKGMKAFNLRENLLVGGSEGKKYERLNNRLIKIAEELQIDFDLWTLDAMWWVIDEKGIKAVSAAEILDEEDDFPEGKAVYRTHKYYERNSGLVSTKKQIAQDEGSLICSICDFDFHKVYGEIGKGFIECHHITPVSEYSSKTSTKIEDLALVCSNCHRILHRIRPCLTIEQMRERVL